MLPEKTQQNLRKLEDILDGCRTMLIVMQNSPDPDAIAAAVALRELANAVGIACSLAHGGIVGRAENRAMVRYLGLNLRDMASLDPSRFELVAMVDTQPGTGNNLLTSDRIPDIVIDHHPIRRKTRRARFTDIRSQYGSTATILYEYLKAAGIPITPLIATALIYGIRSDTQDLRREACKADINAFLDLYATANKRMLGQIVNATVPCEYFGVVSTALSNARIYGGCLVSDLGEVHTPDMIAEIADFLLRHDETTWVLTLGVWENGLRLSIRTSELDFSAGELIREVVKGIGTGGGHDTYAGGQVELQRGTKAEIQKLSRALVKRFREALGYGNRRATRLITG